MKAPGPSRPVARWAEPFAAAGDGVTGLCFSHAYAEFARLGQEMASPRTGDRNRCRCLGAQRFGGTAGGRLVAFSSGGGVIDAYELLARSASAIGFEMARIARGEPETYARWHDELWYLHLDGTIRTRVHAEIPLAEAARAHEIIEAHRNVGKVVLINGT